MVGENKDAFKKKDSNKMINRNSCVKRKRA